MFWTDYNTGVVGRADLAGGNAATFGGLNGPYGIAVDAAAGRLFIGEYSGDRVSVMNLDGSGLAPLHSDAAVIDASYGLSLDPVAGRLFWASDGGPSDNTLSSVRTNGADGGSFLGGVPQLDDPVSPVVDPARNRIYWANYGNGTICYADLDTGAGAGTITLTGACTSAPIASPYAVAVDPVGGRLVVGGYGSGSPAPARAIVAALDGSGCATVVDEVVGTGDGIEGVAIDTDTGKAYLAARTKILVHTLGTPGTTALAVGPVTLSYASFPALLKAPAGSATVAPAGPQQTGATLTCGATWSIGTPSAALYRSPASATTYVWTRDGAEIPGAVAATHVPGSPGSYVCRAIASNAAGTTTVAAEAVTVAAPAPPAAAPAGKASLAVSVKAAKTKLRRSGKVSLTIRTTNTGTVAATKVKTCVKLAKGFKVSGSAKLCATRASLAAGAAATRSITLKAGRKPGTFALGATAEAGNAARVSATGKRRATVKVR